MAQWIQGVLLPLLLVGAGIFYAGRLKLFYLRHPIRLLRALAGHGKADGASPGRALCLALAGTLGVGNIVGVSSAIALGGAGAVLWMWVSAICAMVLKYAEIVLAMRHRRYDREGKAHGAAMYYIRDFFAGRGLPRFGAWLAGGFAILCLLNTFSMGSLLQVNAVASALEGVFFIPPVTVGILLGGMVLLFSLRGRGGLLRPIEYLVPWMTVGYVVLSLAVLIVKREDLPRAFSLIFEDTFSGRAAAGGAWGVISVSALRYGCMRGLISNEAGCGTAPAAHAIAEGSRPAEQGVLGMVEVFVDTILLCTLTALVVLVGNGVAQAPAGDFMMMTVAAYASVLGRFAGGFMAIAVLCFGVATILCWAHYGMECIFYFWKGKGARILFSVCYALSVFLGTLLSSDFAWQLADFAIAAMTLLNLLVLCPMSGSVVRETEQVFGK